MEPEPQEDPSSSVSHSPTHPSKRQRLVEDNGKKTEEEFKRPPPRTMGVELHPTASEDDLLNADFWFESDEFANDLTLRASERERVKRFYDCSVSAIRDAYLSIKVKNGSSHHLLLVLRDDFASWALLHFAFCLHRIYDTLCELRQMQLSLSQKFRFRAPPAESEPIAEDKSSGSTSQPSMDQFIFPRELEEQNMIVKRQCIKCNLKYRVEMDFNSQTDVLCGLEKFLLLVEEEFIRSSGKQEAEGDMETTEVGSAAKTIEGIDAENMCDKCRSPLNPDQDSEVLKTIHEDVMRSNSERTAFSTLFFDHLKLFQRNLQRGFVGRYIVDEETARLMCSVEAIVGQLWDDIAARVLTLSELTDSICARFHADNKFYKIGLEYEEQVCKLTKALRDDLATSFSILGGNLELYRIFRGLMESINRHQKLKVWQLFRPKWLHQQ